MIKNSQAERLLLSWLLTHPDDIARLKKIAPNFSGAYFTDQERSDLFEAMEGMYDTLQCHKFDPQLLEDYATASGGEVDATMINLLIEQTDKAEELATNDPFGWWSGLVIRSYRMQKLADLARKIDEIANDSSIMFASDAYIMVDSLINDFQKKNEAVESNIFKDGLNSILERGKQLKEQGLDHVLSTGFSGLDKQINGGLSDASLNIVAARAGTGKTAFMLNMMCSMMKNQNLTKPVAFFSLEMSLNELSDRVIAHLLKANIQTFITQKATSEQYAAMAYDLQQMSARNGQTFRSLFWSEKSGLTIEELSLQAKNLASRTGGLGALFIDYLGLIKTRKNYENRSLQVGMVTHALLELAKELNCPIVCAAQLNRQIDQRNNKEDSPKNSYLRESGDIENDADLIMMLTPGDFDNAGGREVRLHLTKNRSGSPTGDRPIPLKFYGEKFTFVETVPDSANYGYSK